MLYPIELLGHTTGRHVNGRSRICHAIRSMESASHSLAATMTAQPFSGHQQKSAKSSEKALEWASQNAAHQKARLLLPICTHFGQLVLAKSRYPAHNATQI